MEAPLVSIVIPVYNGARYLREAVDSALAQTYRNTEVLVVNDGSDDGGETDRIARSYGDRIRYFKKENGGVATALNLGIREMRGSLFSWLSHDDVYLPEKVRREAEFLQALGDSRCVVYSGYRTIDGEGRPLRDHRLPRRLTENLPAFLSLETEYTLNGCTMLIPRELLLETPFDESLRYTQDYALWARWKESVRFVYLDEVLFLSRQHAGQGGRGENGAALREADLYRSGQIAALPGKNALAYAENDLAILRHTARIFQNNGYEQSGAAVLALLERCRQLPGLPRPAWKHRLRWRWRVMAETVKKTIVSLRASGLRETAERIKARLINR